MFRKIIEYRLVGPMLWFGGMLILLAGIIAISINHDISKSLETPLTLFMLTLFIYYVKRIKS